jgi:hypothetical protein
MTALEIYKKVFVSDDYIDDYIDDAEHADECAASMEKIRDAATLQEARAAIAWWDCWSFDRDIVDAIVKVRKLWNINEQYCVVCGAFIQKCELDSTVKNIPPESDMWHGGVVDTVEAGYGSCHDGDVLLIAICDNCMSCLRKSGRATFVSNIFGMPNQFMGS